MVAALALLAIVAWAMVARGLLAAELRRQVVSRLEEAFNRPVALGSISGDLLHGVELNDLVVAEPGGFSRGIAFSADRVLIAFDYSEALRGRGVVGSIARVEIRHPHLVIRRDADGAWNLEDLFAEQRTPLPPVFHGVVTVRDGSIAYADARNADPSPFVTDLIGVAGTLDFRRAGDVPAQLTGRFSDGAEASMSGRLLPAAGTVDAEILIRHGGVGYWGDYLIRLAGLRWLSGRFDGRVHVLATPALHGITLDYAGTFQLTDAAAQYAPTNLMLRRITGDVTLDSETAQTPGLTFEANGAPVSMRGDIAYAGGPWLDLAVRSSGLDLAGLRALFFPRARLGFAGQVTGEMWITGPWRFPYLDGDVTAARGRLNRQAVAALSTRFQYAGGILSLETLTATVAGGRISGDAVIDVASQLPSYRFAGTAEHVDAAIFRSTGLGTADGLAGSMSGGMVAVEEGGRIRVMAGMTMGSGSVPALAFDGFTALFWDDGGRVDLDYLGARIGSATVYASGRLGATGALDLDVTGLDVPLDEASARAGLTGPGVSGQADLRGRLTGTAAAPVLAGTVTATRGSLGPVAFDFARGDLLLTPARVSFGTLDLLDRAAHYRVTGGVAFHPLSALHLRVDAEGVDAGRLAGEASGIGPVTGTLSASLSVDGPLDRASAAGEVVFAHGSVGGRRVDRAEAQFTALGPLVRLESGQVQINTSHVNAAGTVDLRGPVDVRLWSDDFQLTDLDAILALGAHPRGTIVMTGGVRGTVRDPQVYGNLSSRDLSLHGQAFQASGVVTYQRGVLRFSPLELTQGAGSYRLLGDLKLGARPTADLALDVQGGRISTITGATASHLPFPIEGTVDGQVTLAGPLEDPSARLLLHLQDGRLGKYPIDGGAADLTLSHGAVEIQEFRLQPPRGVLAAQGKVDLAGTSAVEVSGQDLDADILRALLGANQPLAGRLNFTVQFSGPTRNPTAGLSIDAVDAGLPGALADRILVQAYYKDGIVHIEDSSITKGPHKLVIGGTLPLLPISLTLDPNGPMQLHLALQDTDLSLLSVLMPQVHDASGTLAGEVEVGGTVGDPQMTGFVRSSGGSLRVGSLQTPLEQVGIDIAFSQDQILVRDLSAAMGRGRLTAHGIVAVSNFRPETITLGIDARQATVDFPGLYTGQVDAALQVAGPAALPTLSGTVTLSDGHVQTSARISPPGPTSIDLALDVLLVAGNNVRIDQGPIRAGLAGSLHLGGTLAQPALAGRVTSQDATVLVLGTPFRVTEGSIVFPGAFGLEPEISARAQAQYGATQVFMDVEGPISQLDQDITWSSNPPLSQAEILGLVTGTSGISGTGGGAFGQMLLGSLAPALQRALHLDEFTISYGPQNPVTLRIGKYLIQNLYFSVSEVLPPGQGGPATVPAVPAPGTLVRLTPTTQSYTVVGLEYFLSPSVSVGYDVDTLGDSGVFILTRVPF